MPRPRTFDPDDVLERAVDLFREHGFEGASIPLLTERLGICRQSLYNAYGDKRGLFLAALERWGQREVDSKLALLDAPAGSPLENLRTVVSGWAALATRCPGEGCLTVSAIVQNHGDTEALAVVEKQVERLEQGFFRTLERAKEAGELTGSASPKRMAQVLATTCYGIDVVSRLPGSGPRIGGAVASLLALIDDAATP